MDLGCMKCASCCKKMGAIVEDAKKQLADEDAKRLPMDFVVLMGYANFPHKFTEEGVCEKLVEGNYCSVYLNRPDVCNTTRSFKKFYKQFMSRKQFNDAHRQQCKLLSRIKK